MKKYKIVGDGIEDTEAGAFIPKDIGNQHYRAFLLWCEGKGVAPETGEVVDLGTGPQEPDPEFTEAELAEQDRQASIDAIISNFESAISQPVECTVNGATYFMDGRQHDAESMKHGIELAELTGATSMDIVDYYNQVHEAVPLVDCYEIMLQQATYYLTHWTTKSKDRAAMNSTQEEQTK
ncbi:hypothetical protein DSCO28_50330 [Desulfosarcina ovata subsp. sediminis]|uniref:DUF4376 domain-containing protein n=1 Tax=Desulfosarcina ovata subsp. sediminis TaxID=885957 RepID=A0A5K7ZW35_9BACT|nr:hypothetical protein [Desulfosarcina ovata]BBO80161.1 hypothetical protein DSCO28_07270 [Desulfosarcina ovata subsp. sediminis]BBO84467.1 hypothetical protein DSCO28_50330 [Desulfosarcina ovata subsp. sediminis]